MVFVADDLAAWLIGVLADAVRKKLTSVVFGSEQERALRSAATAALQRTATDLCAGDAQRAEELAIMIGPLFKTPVSTALLGEQATVLEALQVAIAEQLKLLDNPGLTATVQSLTGMRDVSATIVAQKLTEHLLQEIMARGSRGGLLEPLANQLSHDRTYLQGQRSDDKLLEILALLGGGTRVVAAAPVALAQLPAATAGFTGRDDELALLAGLLDPAGTSGPVVSAVAGLAGVGKTTLAVQAARAARDRGWFAGGVLFVDLHGYDEAPVEAGQALGALLRALGVAADHIPPTEEERAGLYRSVVAQIGNPVLVIADNASAEAQVRPLLPGAGPHKVLVTSRHTLAGLGARLVDVSILDDYASIDLLQKALQAARPDDERITSDRKAAVTLAHACGGLPLALQITAALLNADPVLSVSELVDELTDDKRRLETLQYEDGSGIHALSVAAAFRLSYRHLDPATARMFRLLPVNPGPDVSTAAAAVLAGLVISEVRPTLAGLARAHLIESARGAAGRWRMHDLVRLYSRRLSEDYADVDGRDRALDRLFGYYLGKARAADAHLRALPGAEVPAGFTGREEALAWLDAERACLVAAVSMAAATGRDGVTLELPIVLAEYLSWRRQFDDWAATSAVSAEAAQRFGDRHSEGVALGNLGTALREARRFSEAITACENAAEIFRQTGDRSGEGIALNNLGTALQGARAFGEAITACQNAAEIFRHTGARRFEGAALGNLGTALRNARRYDEAITACQNAAEIFRGTGDRHSEGSALNNVGLAQLGAQRYDEAITACKDAAAIYRETGDRYGEGIALNNLGLALLNARRYGEAVTACQDAAEIFRETGDQDYERIALESLEETRTAMLDKRGVSEETLD